MAGVCWLVDGHVQVVCSVSDLLLHVVGSVGGIPRGDNMWCAEQATNRASVCHQALPVCDQVVDMFHGGCLANSWQLPVQRWARPLDRVCLDMCITWGCW
jgi:hypothetical protein